MSNKYAVETAFKLIDQATAPLAKIGVKGNAVGKQLKKDFMKAQDQLAGIGKAAKKAGLMIVAAGAAAAGAFAVKGIKDAIEFNKEFTKVSTVADTTEISLAELSKQVMEVSNKTGVAASELAKFQYQVINSGIKTADSASYVEAAVRASKAAFTDTGVVIEGLTKVMNAYQLEASEAEKIAGQMYLSTTIGNASFEELNSSLGRVLPTAARLNVKTDELFASIASLTANSIETPKAVKGIEKILETVQNPTDRVARAARQLGIDFSTAALESKGLAGFLEDIKQKTGGSEDAIMALFGSVDSLNAINILTSRGAETFTHALAEMGNAAGAVDTAFNKVMESPAERWGLVMNKIKNAGINLGTALLPIVEKVMIKVDDFANKLIGFDFQPIADKIASVFEKIWGFINMIIKLADFIWGLRVPIMAVVGAILLYKGSMLGAALVVNGYTAAQNTLKAAQLMGALVTGNQTKAMGLYKAGTMAASFQTILFAARQKIAMAVNFVGSLIRQGAAFVALTAQMIGAKIATIAYAVAQKAAAVAGHIAAAAQWALNAAMSANPIGLIILGVIALIAAIILLVKNWDKVVAAFKVAFEAIGNFFVMVWEGIKKFFGTVVEFVKKNALNILNVILGILFFPAGVIMAVVRLIIKHWDKIKEALGKVGEFIKGVFNKVKEGVTKVWSGIKEGAGKAWEGIKNGASKAWEGIKNGVSKLKNNGVENFNKFKEGARVVFNKVLDVASWGLGKIEGRFPGVAKTGKEVLGALRQAANGDFSGIKEIGSKALEKLQTGFSTFKDIASEKLGSIGDFFTGVFDKIKEAFQNVIDFFMAGVEKIKGFFSGIGDAIGGFIGGIGDFLTGNKNKTNTAPQVNNIVPPAVNQTSTRTAGITPNIPANVNSRETQTITAATAPATRPVTRAEQYSYSQNVNREELDINVRAEQGSTANVTRPPRSPNVRVTASGGNT